MEKIAFVFPGQGSQYVGMCKSLCEQFDIAKKTFDEASDILGLDLGNLCFNGSLAELSKTENSLVAILTASVAAFRVYMKEIGVAPQFCTGHSLGEYSALTCSGAIRFADTVKIVRKRSILAQEVANTGAGCMTIIDNIKPELVDEECRKISTEDKNVSVSCFNSSSQVAISGYTELVQKVEDVVLEKGGQVTPLFGSAPFHSVLMAEAAVELRKELEKYDFCSPRYPVIANICAGPYEGPEKVGKFLADQLIKPVQWQKTMQYLEKWGVTLTIEIGPKNVLSGLIRNNMKDVNALCFDQKEDRQNLKEFLGQNPLYSKHVPTIITRCLAIGVATENKCFDNNQYDKGVIQPYKRIQSIQEELDKAGSAPSLEQMKEALGNLQTVLNTKMVPAKEQAEWFSQIFDETGTNYLFPEYEKTKA
jgi:[acyl-carrier-protein] S-malonyltransferase